MAPIYAIGDIHGQLEMLEIALERVETDGGADAKVVFLGDYFDRGPDSRGVIDRLIEGRESGRDWVFLKGNHDRMMEWFTMNPPRHDPHLLVGYHWLHDRLGGIETLASYGVHATEKHRLADVADAFREQIPQMHVDFLTSLALSHSVEGMFFVHAGIRPGLATDQQSENDLLWIREPFHSDTRDHGALIVHGHTPVDRAMHYGNRVNLDSGAGYGRPLTAAVFDDSGCWTLTAQGRVPLEP